MSSHTWIPTPTRQERGASAAVRYGAPAFVFLAALVLYWRTLLPGQAFDDWGEMQVVPHIFGIPHPTGYPTYILLAWLFELLPLGSIAFRANLFAAVCVAVALAAITRSQLRLNVRPVIAIGASLATGAIGTIWLAAVVAEVNALHLAFIALILDRSLAWTETRRFRDLGIGAVLIGLSMGNHVLTAFVVPFVALFVLWAGRDELSMHPRWVLAAAGLVIAGASVYTYLPIAASLGPALPYNSPTTPEAFIFLVTGRQFAGQYGGLFTPEGPAKWLASLPDLVGLAVTRATVILPPLTAIGALVLLLRRPAFGLAVLGTVLLCTYIWANYLRLEHYLLVGWLLAGLLAGVGLDGLANAVGIVGRGRARVERVGSLAGAAAAVAMAAVLVVANFGASDQSQDHTAQVYVDKVFNILPQDAVIFSFWGPSPPLWYAQQVDHRRPDVTVVDDTNIVYEGWGTREARVAAFGCTRPMYAIFVSDHDAASMRGAGNRLTQVDTVVVGALGWSGRFTLPLWQIQPQACTTG